MKLIKLLTIFLFISISIHYIKSQQYIVEQNSGVVSALNSIDMNGNNLVWICGDGGVVIKSEDLGSTWQNVSGNIPSNINLFNISCAGMDTALTAGNIGATTYVYRTTDGGSNWSQVFTQANGKINAIWVKNNPYKFMVGNPVNGRWSLWKSFNGGADWDSTGLYLPQNNNETGWNNSLALIQTEIWFGTNNGRIYMSDNNGFGWNSISTLPETNSTAIWIDYTFDNSVYFGGNNIYYSTNEGANWTEKGCPDTGKVKGFSEIHEGVDLYPDETIAIRNNSYIYVSQKNSNFISIYTAPSGFYNYMGNDQTFYHYTWAVRSNGGITRIQLYTLGSVQNISTIIPHSSKLEQNFPNPFNPVTKIRFQINKTAFTTVKIYNALGSGIAEVVNENLHAGEYEASFDAGNLASGIYYYSIQAGDFTDVKKMVLLK